MRGGSEANEKGIEVKSMGFSSITSRSYLMIKL